MVLAAAVGGCSSNKTESAGKDSGWFSNSFDLFAKPDWARPVETRATNLGPRGPVAPEDLVAADGTCAPAAAPAAPAQAPEPQPAPAATASAQTGIGFEGGLGAPAPGGGAPAVLGGVALGMSECDAVRRAGHPGNVAISAGDKGERRVVLTYLTGPWPGIYTFDSGRLKVIDRAPEPPKPAKPAPRKKPAPKRAAR